MDRPDRKPRTGIRAELNIAQGLHITARIAALGANSDDPAD